MANFIGIIPARAGSKRLKNKNRLLINGKPLIHWTVLESIKTNILDRLIISTDDKKILDMYGNMHGVEVMRRKPHLATDSAKSADVLLDILESVQSQESDYCVLLQPTSPLRTYKHIVNAIKLAQDGELETVFSVCETEHSPLWSLTLDVQNNVKSFLSYKSLQTRSQDLERYYRLNGAIYVTRVGYLKKHKKLISDKNSRAIVMNRHESVDIDTDLDFKIAELLLQEIKN